MTSVRPAIALAATKDYDASNFAANLSARLSEMDWITPRSAIKLFIEPVGIDAY